jgi:hypothetical protein
MRVLVNEMTALDICCTSAMSRVMKVVIVLVVCEGAKCINISKRVTNICFICTGVYIAGYTDIQILLLYSNFNLNIKTTSNYNLQNRALEYLSSVHFIKHTRIFQTVN